MKKLFNLVLVVMVTLMLSGCEIKKSYEREVEIVNPNLDVVVSKTEPAAVYPQHQKHCFHIHILNKKAKSANGTNTYVDYYSRNDLLYYVDLGNDNVKLVFGNWKVDDEGKGSYEETATIYTSWSNVQIIDSQICPLCNFWVDDYTER